MVEMWGLVAVGILHKRHSAPGISRVLVTEVWGGSPLCLCSRRKMSQSPWSCGLGPVPPCQEDVSEI